MSPSHSPNDYNDDCSPLERFTVKVTTRSGEVIVGHATVHNGKFVTMLGVLGVPTGRYKSYSGKHIPEWTSDLPRFRSIVETAFGNNLISEFVKNCCMRMLKLFDLAMKMKWKEGEKHHAIQNSMGGSNKVSQTR